MSLSRHPRGPSPERAVRACRHYRRGRYKPVSLNFTITEERGREAISQIALLQFLQYFPHALVFETF
jgi:hypothetical protein